MSLLANKKMSYYSLFIKYLIAVWLISIKFKDSVQLKSEECRHVFFLVCKKRWSKFCIYCILLTVEQLKEHHCRRYKIRVVSILFYLFMVCRQFNVFKLHRLLVTSLHIGYELLNKPTWKLGMVETFFVCVKEQHYLLMVCRQFYDFQLHRLLIISKQGNLRLIFDGRLVMYLYTCAV